MADLTLEALRGELAPIRAELEAMRAEVVPIRARLDGLPLINRTVTGIQQDARSLKAAVNDFAATNVTTGEITALHEDVNRALAANIELEARIITLERLVRELQRQS